MKKNILVAAGVAMALAFSPNISLAQSNAPAPESAASASNQPPAAANPLPPKRPLRPYIVHAISDLQSIKKELRNSQDDFGGRKDSVIASCDKTIQELTAIMKTLPAPPQRPGHRPGRAVRPPMAPPSSEPAQPSAQP